MFFALQPAKLATLSSATLIVFLAGTSPGFGQDQKLLTEVLEAWKNRQKDIQRVSMTWIEKETHPKGSLSKLMMGEPLIDKKRIEFLSRNSIPPRDTTFEVQGKLSIDGDKYRYTVGRREWSAEDNDFIELPVTVVFDGKEGRTLQEQGSSKRHWPVGTIQTGHTRDNSPVVPLGAFRPFFLTRALMDIETAVPRLVAPLEKKTALVEFHRTVANVSLMLRVDPIQEFQMVSYLATRNQRTKSRIDVKYKKDGEGRTVPAAWNQSSFDEDGNLESSSQCSAQSVTINAPISASEWSLDFSFGTRVIDSRDSSNVAHYIVKDSGTKRFLTAEDSGKSYEQILHSEQPRAVSKLIPWPIRRIWAFVLGFLLVAVSGSYFALKKLRLR